MALDLPLDPKLWLPPKPAIIRAAEPEILRQRNGVLLTPPPFLMAKNQPVIAAVGAVAKGSGSSVSVSPPAGIQNGDSMLLLIGTESGNISGPGGTWSEDSNSPAASGNFFATSARLTAYRKTTSGTESSVSVGLGGSHVIAVMLAIRFGTFNVSNDGTATTGSASVSIAGVTTTLPNCLVIDVCTTSNAATIDSWANANLTGLTELLDDSTTDDDDGGLKIAYGYKGAAGATGATTATLSASSAQGNMKFAYAPV